MSYTCAPCQGANPVTTIVTSLKDGSTDQSCDQDLPIMLIGQLALVLQLDPAALYEHIKVFTDQADAAENAAEVEQDRLNLGLPDEQDEPRIDDDIAGDAVDDQGGMSEHQHAVGGDD